MKKIESSDKKVIYTYYEKDKVEIRYVNNKTFKITIYKPGRKQDFGTTAYASPVVEIGQSCTQLWSIQDLKDMQNRILEAIKILNSEKTNLIDLNFQITNERVPFEKIKRNVKNIKASEISKYKIYKQSNDEMYIYLGKGDLFIDNDIENRCGCKYVYYHVQSLSDITFGPNGIMYLKCNPCSVDTVTNARKFVEEVKSLPVYNRVKIIWNYSREESELRVV